jgi:4-amino-4-deoxy-L-arabinose transferase-like glycosyltransferase
MRIKKYKLELLFFLLIFINFVIRIPFANMPANFDELNYFSGAKIVYENNLNPFIEFWGYKPPLLFFLVAAAFRLGSLSRFWGRILIYVFSSLALLFNYLLAKQMFNKTVARYSTFFLLTFPLFITQSFLFTDSVPILALFLATLYFYFSEINLGYIVSASLLLLTKEPMIFVPVILLFFSFIQKENVISRKIIYTPVLVFAVWALLNKVLLGWFLWPYNVSLFSIEIFNIYKLLRPLRIIFIENFHGLILGFIILYLIRDFLLNTDKIKKNKIKLLLFFYFFYLLFSLNGPFLFRYILFICPLIFIVFSFSIEKLCKKKAIQQLFVLIICLLFLGSNLYYLFYGESFINYQDRNLSLFGAINLNRKAVDYVKKSFSSYVVISEWPLAALFEDSLFGFVESSELNVGVNDDNLNEKVKAYEKNGNRLIYMKYATSSGDKKKMIAKQKFRLAKEVKLESFPNNDDRILIYLKD